MSFKRMACQLLEIVDGDLTVCFEYGEHRELCMNVGVWLTIYKHDASVSMPLQSLGVLLAQDTPALFRETGVLSKSELGSKPCMDFGDGRLHVEPDADADGLFRGRLALYNGGAALRGGGVPSARHRLALTLAEQRALVAIVNVLSAYDEAISLGLARTSSGTRRGHRLTPETSFVFAGDMHTCDFTPGGEFLLEPFNAVACYCCEHHDAEARLAKARLRLTRADALRLLEFGAAELGANEADTEWDEADRLLASMKSSGLASYALSGGSLADTVGLPRDGRVHRVNDERSIGVFRSPRYFPDMDEDDDEAYALVPLLLSEWRWLRACLRLYLAAGDYLRC